MVKSSAYGFCWYLLAFEFIIFFVNNYLFLTMHSNVTIKNVSWPHFSWATLYVLHYETIVTVADVT